MGHEGIILVNSPISTFQQSLTHSAVAFQHNRGKCRYGGTVRRIQEVYTARLDHRFQAMLGFRMKTVYRISVRKGNLCFCQI